MIFSVVFFFSCVHRITFPGPTRSVGEQPKTYAERYDIKILSTPTLSASASSKEKQQKKRQKKHAGEEVASIAGDYIGKTKLHVGSTLFRYDCSGLVEAMYFAAGIPIRGSAKMMYEQSKENHVFHKDKIPLAGDLIFFDNTHDRNKNGRRDDVLTHVAIVESVDDNGTISMIHLGSRGIARIFMNLYHPDLYKDEHGNILNSFLRAPSKDNGPRLTGELFVGFGSLWRIEPTRPSTMSTEEDFWEWETESTKTDNEFQEIEEDL